MIVTLILPAYNCAKTLHKTLNQIPTDIIDHIILVDDKSTDNTVSLAMEYGIKHIYQHEKNLGYGANQKTCYNNALKLNSDIVIMLHPDNQYDPHLISMIISKIQSGADVVLASRMLKGKEAIKGGMPTYKYYFNLLLTKFQNKLFSMSLSEYHTGYRAYTKNALLNSKYNTLSNSFIFDNQILLQLILKKYKIEEIYCPAKYTSDSSSISFMKSVSYGFGIIYFSFKAKSLQYLHQYKNSKGI